jgi:predicted GIY-YIG superfamily endonuclease
MQEFLGGSDGGPAMAASKTDRLIKSNIRNLASIFENGLDAGGDSYEVYVKKDRYGNVAYVGITKSLGRRAKEHGEDLHSVASGLTKLQARAIETAAIERFGKSNAYSNKIRSISPRRRLFYEAAMAWGTKQLESMNGVNW